MSTELFPGSEKYPLLTLPPQLIRMSECWGGHEIYLWRDDPEDFAFGGNKVRFYEYLIPEILNEAPDVLVTSGSRFSNHLRVTAAVSARLGIPCELLVNEEPPEDGALPEGNLTLAAAFGAHITFIGSFAALLKINEYADSLRKEGKKVYVVPTGGHTPGAVRAYASVLADALMQLDNYGIGISDVYLPCASGTTLAGLCCGARLLAPYGVNIPRFTAYHVANTEAGVRKGVDRLIRGAEKRFGAFSPSDVGTTPAVADCGKNDYGCPDEELLALRADVERDDGVTLDRTYNVNAFFGMKQALEAAPGAEKVLYIHTGGYTG